MTPHRGVANGWDVILSEATGLAPDTRDFGRSEFVANFVLAANTDSLQTGGAFLTLDGGATWTELTDGLPAKGKNYRAAAVDPASTSTAYVGNADGSPTRQGVYLTTHGGTTWSQVLSGVPVNALAVAPAPLTSYVFAATPAGIYRTTDKGSTWGLDGAFPVVDVVVAGNGSSVYAVAPDRVRRSTTGAPGTWVDSFPPGAGYDLRAITRPHAFAPNWVCVGGAATTAGPAGLQEGDPVLYRSSDSGAT